MRMHKQSGDLRSEHRQSCKPLKNDEMHELQRRRHHGDKDARDELICGNLRLVLSVIQHFTADENPMTSSGRLHIGSSRPSIISTQAMVMFSTYGVPIMYGEVKRFLRDNNAVRVSRSMRDTACAPCRSKSS